MNEDSTSERKRCILPTMLSRVLMYSGAVLGAIMALASIPPEEATSNVAKWIKFIGIDQVPSLLTDPTIDKWFAMFGSAVFAISIFALVVRKWPGILGLRRLSIQDESLALSVEQLNGKNTAGNDSDSPSHFSPGQDQNPATPAGSLEAFAYGPSTDNEKIAVRWKSPTSTRFARIELEIIPEGQSRRMVLLGEQKPLLHGQDVETLICRLNENSTWVWCNINESIMFDGSHMCRLVIIDDKQNRWFWKFAIADRESREPPKIIGENLFNASFG